MVGRRGGGGVKHNFGDAAISSHLEIELNSRAFAALVLELGSIKVGAECNGNFGHCDNLVIYVNRYNLFILI